MDFNADNCYQALIARDPRFDGQFFVGVTTTQIYCRPICPARTPGRDRCRFFRSAAAAERLGFRPCLRCRPERAPGSASVDANSRIAKAVLSVIDESGADLLSVGVLAQGVGVSDRHLRRVVAEAYGCTPRELVQTQRLLQAKRLLTDTQMPLGEVSVNSGFGSVRRFNAVFQERYRLSPSALRKGSKHVVTDDFSFDLPFRPPFDYDSLLQFLASHATPGVELVNGQTYSRTVSLRGHVGVVAVCPVAGRLTLKVSMSVSLAPVFSSVLAKVRQLFDLDADPVAIDSQLGVLAENHLGLRVPGAFDGFELVVRTVLGQQVSVKAATTLAARLAARFGQPIDTNFAELTHLSPSHDVLANATVDQVSSLGILPSRARTIIAFAQAVSSGEVTLSPQRSIDQTMAELMAIPGIGCWTAQYVAMRALSWPDAFPHTDLAILKALGTRDPKVASAASNAWKPWRSYAAMHLWKSLETTP